MQLRTLVPFTMCVVAFATSCGTEPTLPTGAPSTLSFSYSGFRTGAFTATGFPPDVRTGTRWTAPWAAADNFTITSKYTEITASQPSGSRNHLLTFILPQATTGTFPLGAAHTDFRFNDAVIFELNPETGAGEQYVIKAGSVIISSAVIDRIAGTFTATAVDSVRGRTIEISNGSFDVFIGQP